ncbi:MAG: LysR substrate-binding domain-containing protein [Burkholderiales bacterium]
MEGMKHMRVTWNQLRLFRALARHASFTRAARELHVVQPTVSAQMKQLTDMVGLPLYEQVGKKIHITQAGTELSRTIDELNEAWARFEMKIADLKGVKAGRLRIAIVTTAKYFVPRILGPFCKRYPGIDVALEIVNRNRVLERLAENMDDFYILGVPPEGKEFERQRFLENPLVVIAPVDHPMASKRNISLEQLAKERFIVRESGSGTRITIDEFFGKARIKPLIKMELSNNEAIKWAVAGGLGLSIVSEHSLLFESMQDKLAVLDVQGFPIKKSWYTVYPAGKELSVVAHAFLDHLVEEARIIQAELDQRHLPTSRRSVSSSGRALAS